MPFQYATDLEQCYDCGVTRAKKNLVGGRCVDRKWCDECRQKQTEIAARAVSSHEEPPNAPELVPDAVRGS